MSVRVKGSLLDADPIRWGQSFDAGKRKLSTKESKEAIALIQNAYDRIGNGEKVILPIVAYYGAGRAWLPHNQRKQAKAKPNAPSNRWEAFYDSLNDRIRLSDLNAWFRSEAIERGNRGGTYRPGFDIILKAVFKVVPGADGLSYDSAREEIVLSIDGNPQPFGNLSAGQRILFALVADIAIKMVTQNNFLVPRDALADEDNVLPRVLRSTPGVVLIDELDVHLHPKWQRRIVEALKSTFPEVQFITTTHSPFVVQSLREEELLNLQGQPVPQLGNLSVNLIANGLMGVDRPDVSRRYAEMVDAAKGYLLMLEEAVDAPENELAVYERQLADRVAPYADNPAFQAFLELKHAARLGPRRNGLGTEKGES